MENAQMLKITMDAFIRRTSVPRKALMSKAALSQLQGAVRALFGTPAGAPLQLTYADNEGDRVALITDSDVHDAVHVQKLNPLLLEAALAPPAQEALPPEAESVPAEAPGGAVAEQEQPAQELNEAAEDEEKDEEEDPKAVAEEVHALEETTELERAMEAAREQLHQILTQPGALAKVHAAAAPALSPGVDAAQFEDQMAAALVGALEASLAAMAGADEGSELPCGDGCCRRPGRPWRGPFHGPPPHFYGPPPFFASRGRPGKPWEEGSCCRGPDCRPSHGGPHHHHGPPPHARPHGPPYHDGPPHRHHGPPHHHHHGARNERPHGAPHVHHHGVPRDHEHRGPPHRHCHGGPPDMERSHGPPRHRHHSPPRHHGSAGPPCHLAHGPPHHGPPPHGPPHWLRDVTGRHGGLPPWAMAPGRRPLPPWLRGKSGSSWEEEGVAEGDEGWCHIAAADWEEDCEEVEPRRGGSCQRCVGRGRRPQTASLAAEEERVSAVEKPPSAGAAHEGAETVWQRPGHRAHFERQPPWLRYLSWALEGMDHGLPASGKKELSAAKQAQE